MPGKTALVLSGGGAKGAFECGAEKYAREMKGYKWDIIAGVSVGALNGSMLAMEKYSRLFEIWNTVSNNQVYTGGFNLWSGFKLLFGAKSFYGNAPLRRLLEKEFEPDRFKVDLRVGSVSLVTGEYVQFKPDMPNFSEAVLASTVMPIIWVPLDISPQFLSMVDGGVRNISPLGDILDDDPQEIVIRTPQFLSMVDGGVRNISPLGDILDDDPQEIVIINCSPEAYNPLPAPPEDILKIGLRTLDILLNEIFRNDLDEFLRINALVKEAESQGFKLHNPATGKELKYFEAKVIEPKTPLGDTLDFSQQSVQRSLHAGWERAREILG